MIQEDIISLGDDLGMEVEQLIQEIKTKLRMLINPQLKKFRLGFAKKE
jgi:hypothetical protein